jgi:hypothetical protein
LDLAQKIVKRLEMAKTKQGNRVIYTFPKIYQQPPRHSTGDLSKNKRAYDLAKHRWTISTTWNILVREEGSEQWYTLEQYDPECRKFKSMRKEDKEKKFLDFDGILLDPLLFEDTAEPVEPSVASAYNSTNKEPLQIRSKSTLNKP